MGQEESGDFIARWIVSIGFFDPPLAGTLSRRVDPGERRVKCLVAVQSILVRGKKGAREATLLVIVGYHR